MRVRGERAPSRSDCVTAFLVGAQDVVDSREKPLRLATRLGRARLGEVWWREQEAGTRGWIVANGKGRLHGAAVHLGVANESCFSARQVKPVSSQLQVGLEGVSAVFSVRYALTFAVLAMGSTAAPSLMRSVSHENWQV